MTRRRSTSLRWVAIVWIVLMSALHVVLARHGIADKSPTFDEPMHAVGAMAALHHGDYRINPEDPPLWRYWAALPTSGSDLPIDPHRQRWDRVPGDFDQQFWFTHDALYRTPGIDAQQTIRRMQHRMTLIGAALVAAAAWLAWRLSGKPVVAMLAAALIAFEPNLLGHSPLLKNDVAQTLWVVLLAGILFDVVRRATVVSVILLSVVAAAWITTKFSGLTAIPTVAAVLFVRALVGPWVAFGDLRRSVWRRIMIVLLIVGSMGVVGVLSIWASYGFRYAACVDGTPLDVAKFLAEARAARSETPDRIADDAFMQTALLIRSARLLPEAYTVGLMQLHARSIERPAFLNGRIGTGFSSYFFWSLAWKAPVGVLALLVVAVAVGATSGRTRWLAAASIPAIYAVIAVQSNLNLGVRHILPAYVPLIVVALTILSRGKSFWIAAALAGVAVVESVGFGANRIAFFNRLAGGSEGGFDRLADSNLDWGQDLPALAAWQRANPHRPMLLSYFGAADPKAYGIRYTNVVPGYPLDSNVADLTPELIRRHPDAVVAISATWLRGVYRPDLEPIMARLRTARPLTILNGTIYLYDASSLE
jgi:hypothetical protein